MKNEKTIEVLNKLIIINNDRIEGYETAAKETEENEKRIKKNAEKGDIFSLAISAFTLLFHDVKAAELSNLKKGPAKVK